MQGEGEQQNFRSGCAKMLQDVWGGVPQPSMVMTSSVEERASAENREQQTTVSRRLYERDANFTSQLIVFFQPLVQPSKVFKLPADGRPPLVKMVQRVRRHNLIDQLVVLPDGIEEKEEEQR